MNSLLLLVHVAVGSWPILTILFILLSGIACAQSQDKLTIFQPVEPQREINAEKTSGKLSIDGKLTEHDWNNIPGVGNFFQVQPYQGRDTILHTRVKVLYDNHYLYIGAYCLDSLGKNGVRVPDLRRDFTESSCDLFEVCFDPFSDKRNAMSFMTNPHSAQRDKLAFDDQLFDADWDALWRVRTNRTDSGWTAEMAIPWKTLRYPKGSTEWGIQFHRVARRLNQRTAWSPFPRAFSSTRMNYAGLLKNIQPPPPAANVRLNPYLLFNSGRTYLNKKRTSSTDEPKIGGEIKWAVNPFTVLDLTFNTDFAQADVDRQVNNLTRFSVFLPERRQFFLENASLFVTGQSQRIQPFFTRQIGLSEGQPVPIDAGVRLVSRNQKRNFGGLVMHQQATGLLTGTTFAVGRYSGNFGNQNHVGGLITAKWSDPKDTIPSRYNYTGSADAFFRLAQPLTWNLMASTSSTSNAGNGYSFASLLTYYSNQWYGYYNQTLVDKNYNPEAGFIYDKNILNTSFGGYRIIRRDWVPKKLRQLDPGAYFNLYHRASDGKFLQGSIEFFPFYTLFINGGWAYMYIVPTWQSLPEPINIVGIAISAGNYYYTRYRFAYANDQSKKFAYTINYEAGGYYNGKLGSWIINARFSPMPNMALSVNYQYNRFGALGEEEVYQSTHLVTPELRLGLNPRIQLITYYQYNTATDRGIVNTRLAWEYRPLTYIYIVYNENRQQIFNTAAQVNDLLKTQSAIFKITFLKQF